MNQSRHMDIQMIKFGWYGLLKNLRFFDPFLVIYLHYEQGLPYLLIGLLHSIKELIVYVFEIPSGIIADQFGKKNELVICFIFYIASFILFFIGNYYFIFVLAFILFGIGEAFRSGTHKAIIMDFMEYHDIKDDKSKVYGKTRSYSMIGSSISSLLSVLLVLWIQNIQILFLIAIIPYIFDILLILSYPEYLNQTDYNKFQFSVVWKGFSNLFTTMKNQKVLRLTILDSSLYNGIFKLIKDYVGPILVVISSGWIISESVNPETNENLVVGIVYALIFLISSIASKHAYRFKGSNYNHSLPIFWFLFFFVSGLFFIFKSNYIIVIVLFVLVYILQNLRKPVMVEKISDLTDKNARATVLSVESQMTSLFIIVAAPLIGLVFDQYGFEYVFMFLGVLSILMYITTKK